MRIAVYTCVALFCVSCSVGSPTSDRDTFHLIIQAKDSFEGELCLYSMIKFGNSISEYDPINCFAGAQKTVSTDVEIDRGTVYELRLCTEDIDCDSALFYSRLIPFVAYPNDTIVLTYAPQKPLESAQFNDEWNSRFVEYRKKELLITKPMEKHRTELLTLDEPADIVEPGLIVATQLMYGDFKLEKQPLVKLGLAFALESSSDNFNQTNRNLFRSVMKENLVSLNPTYREWFANPTVILEPIKDIVDLGVDLDQNLIRSNDLENTNCVLLFDFCKRSNFRVALNELVGFTEKYNSKAIFVPVDFFSLEQDEKEILDSLKDVGIEVVLPSISQLSEFRVQGLPHFSRVFDDGLITDISVLFESSCANLESSQELRTLRRLPTSEVLKLYE